MTWEYARLKYERRARWAAFLLGTAVASWLWLWLR
jgi:arginine exporter protein ArgO